MPGLLSQLCKRSKDWNPSEPHGETGKMTAPPGGGQHQCNVAKHVTHPVPLLAPRGRSGSGGLSRKCALRVGRFCVTWESSYLRPPYPPGGSSSTAQRLVPPTAPGLALVPEGLFLPETWGNTHPVEQTGPCGLSFQTSRFSGHRCHIVPVLSLASCCPNPLCTAIVCFFQRTLGRALWTRS